MKKTLLCMSVAFLSLSAHADTVNVAFVVDSNTPAKTGAITTKENAYAFQGTQSIVVPLLGKTCTWIGSAKATGPKGCNYTVTANLSTMQLTKASSDSNPGCTPAADIISSCK